MKKPLASQVAYGLKEAVKKFKKAKEKPQYPEEKIKWIKMVALKIIDLLEVETKRHNQQYPYNLISSNDLISAASTTLNMLLKVAAKTQKKD